MPFLQTFARNFYLECGIVKTLHGGYHRYKGHKDHSKVVHLIISPNNEFVHEAFWSLKVALFISIIKVLLFKNSPNMIKLLSFIRCVINAIFSFIIFINLYRTSEIREIRYDSVQAINGDLLFILDLFGWSLHAVVRSETFQGIRIPPLVFFGIGSL